MRISDILDRIEKMAAHPELAGHAASLLGPRTRGSTTQAGLDALPRDRELVEELPDPRVASPGCHYFSVRADELNPRLGAICYHLAKRDHPELLKEREGAHGLELYLDQDVPADRMPSSEIVTVIIGPPGEYGFEDGVIYTWHPGLPLAQYKKGQEIHPLTAVKVHRG